MRHFLFLFLFASCASQPGVPFGQAADIEQVLGAKADDTDSVVPPFTGRYRVMHGSSACNSRIVGQGNPMVLAEGTPTAGLPLRIEWTLNPTAPFESRPTLLMIWFEPAEPINLTPFGYPGCLLWAPTKPGAIFTVTPRNGSMLTQEGGRVRLNWTPGSEWVGRKLYSQLVAWSPGANAANWLLSPGLETWVGNTQQ